MKFKFGKVLEINIGISVGTWCEIGIGREDIGGH